MEAGLSLPRGARLTHTLQSPWEIASQWVGPREVYPDETPELAAVLTALSTARIERADVGYKGTQLKALLVLEGGQKVVFKPKRSVSGSYCLPHFGFGLIIFCPPPPFLRYSRDYVVEGEPYAGYDRHNAEVAAFHLDRCANIAIWASASVKLWPRFTSAFEMTSAGSWDSGERPWWWEDTSTCGRRSSPWPRTSC